ncbi:hypothetical protein TNCV_3955421 [Trichonephila clavipes]|nr:hypothetical protein TNCV_3955421 [Trichonephila clavipes]
MSSLGCGVEVRRGGCQLRCCPRHLTMDENYEVHRQNYLSNSDIDSGKRFQKDLAMDREECQGKMKPNLQEALDLLQNLPSEISDALIGDSSDEEVSANNLLEFC